MGMSVPMSATNLCTDVPAISCPAHGNRVIAFTSPTFQARDTFEISAGEKMFWKMQPIAVVWRIEPLLDLVVGVFQIVKRT